MNSESPATPSPDPAVSTGNTVASAVECLPHVSPDDRSAAVVINQHALDHSASVTRSSNSITKGLIHWLEICSPIAMYNSYTRSFYEDVAQEKENAINGTKPENNDISIPTETRHVSSCTCCHADCPVISDHTDVGSGPCHTDQCVVMPKLAPLWVVIIFVAKLPLSIVVCTCRTSLFVTRVGFAVTRLPFVVIRTLSWLPADAAYLPGVRISTWLWLQRQQRRQVAAQALGEIEGMLLAEEHQLRANSSAPPSTGTKSNAAVAGDTCDCAACTHCHPHSMLAPMLPAEAVGSEEATASTDATADATEAVEEPCTQGSGTIPEMIPVPRKKPTSVPEIMAPRRIRRLVRFMQSLPLISRLQRLTNAVYDPTATFVVEHDLATCNAMFWSCIIYFGMFVAHAVGYPTPLALTRSPRLVAMCFFIMYCILSIELQRPLVCMLVKVNDLNAGVAHDQKLNRHVPKIPIGRLHRKGVHPSST
jgi:hypothetical protein